MDFYAACAVRVSIVYTGHKFRILRSYALAQVPRSYALLCLFIALSTGLYSGTLLLFC